MADFSVFEIRLAQIWLLGKLIVVKLIDRAKNLTKLIYLLKQQDVSECVCLLPNSSQTVKPSELKF